MAGMCVQIDEFRRDGQGFFIIEPVQNGITGFDRMGPWMVRINRGEDLVGIGCQVGDVDCRIVLVARLIRLCPLKLNLAIFI